MWPLKTGNPAGSPLEGMFVPAYDVDYSETVGRRAECPDGCGMCCLCQPEILPFEEPFFRKNHPASVCRTKGPDAYTAIKLKKNRGSCVFLGEDTRRCAIYEHRTTYCRQFPYHIYVSDRVQVELDLSCRGLWTGKGADARSEAESLVNAADKRIREAIPEAAEVYRQFYGYAREAGVMRDTSYLRMTVSECISRFTDKDFLYRVLEASSDLPNMMISDAMKQSRTDMGALDSAAREAALESLSTDDPVSMPVYCSPDYAWNVFSADGGKIEWLNVGDDGEFRHRGFADAEDIALPDVSTVGIGVLSDYISVLNARDSFMGSVFFLEDANGYEDDLTNAYYGSLASAILDVMWRASLLDHFFGTGFGADGIREAVMFYDMDRLDAPAIGAFV